jgi:hypothetical protein
MSANQNTDNRPQAVSRMQQHEQMRPFVPVENPFLPDPEIRQSQIEVEELLRQKIEETN